MQFLVTGGAGFIGSNIVDRLLSDGHRVVVVDNESSDAHECFHWNPEAENHKSDINDYDSIRPLFEGVDYVLHLAAESRIQPTIINPIKAVRTNSLGTATVLQCAREANVKRVVYSSTSAAYGGNPIPNVESQPDDCLNPYSVSKVSGEALCSMYYNLFGLETVIFRYFNVYGYREPAKGQYAPVTSIFRKQKQENKPLTITGDGTQRRDFVNVLDVVEANILASSATIQPKQLGTVVNIGSGKNYSINEIANLFSQEYVYIPSRAGEVWETLANNEKAKELLGWSPKVDLIDFLTTNL